MAYMRAFKAVKVAREDAQRVMRERLKKVRMNSWTGVLPPVFEDAGERFSSDSGDEVDSKNPMIDMP